MLREFGYTEPVKQDTFFRALFHSPYEFEHEMETTRLLLERLPAAQADWKPHAKSRSLGELACHLVIMFAVGGAEVR